MFLGHAGVALAVKRAAPQVSLGTTLLAAFWLDVLWPVLVLAGVERVEIAPGITRVTPLDFTHYPWSHSLATALGWGALFGAIHYTLRRNFRTAAWLAALVASHWGLDWIVHRPDLPLYPGDETRHGLGLWNSLPMTLVLEAAVFGVGVYIYAASTRARDRFGAAGFWGFIAFLVACYAAAVFGPPPPSIDALALSGLLALALMAWAAWVDRHRDASGSIS